MMHLKQFVVFVLSLLVSMGYSQVAVNVLYQDNQCKSPVLYQYQPSGCSNQYNVILEENEFEYEGYWRQVCNAGDSKIAIQLCDDDSSCSNCRNTLTFPTNSCVVVNDSYIYQHQSFSCINKIPNTVKGALRLAAWEENECSVGNWDTSYLFDISLGCIANYAYDQPQDGFHPPTSINLTCNNFAFFFDFCWDSPQKMCPSQNCTASIALQFGCWNIYDDFSFWINCNAGTLDEAEYSEPIEANKGFNTDVLKIIASKNPVINTVKNLLEKMKARALSKPKPLTIEHEQLLLPFD